METGSIQTGKTRGTRQSSCVTAKGVLPSPWHVVSGGVGVGDGYPVLVLAGVGGYPVLVQAEEEGVPMCKPSSHLERDLGPETRVAENMLFLC